jgi:hypothetical protein
MRFSRCSDPASLRQFMLHYVEKLVHLNGKVSQPKAEPKTEPKAAPKAANPKTEPRRRRKLRATG